MDHYLACLPIRIWLYLHGNRPAVWISAHISQNADKEFPESMEVMKWTITSSLPAKSTIECWWSYLLLIFAYFKPFVGLKYTAGPDWSKKLFKPINLDFEFKALQKQAWPIMVAHSPQATKNVCGRPEVPQVLAHVASKKM